MVVDFSLVMMVRFLQGVVSLHTVVVTMLVLGLVVVGVRVLYFVPEFVFGRRL